MGIHLYSHNQRAYESACTLLQTVGKAAVIHPTGTGKSFIAFKLAEDHPSESFLWLGPSDYIYQTQIENLTATGAAAPSNIVSCTYARLAQMDAEALGNLHPDYIILDEFHRCGAEKWGEGVQRLLDLYQDAPVLGLTATSIRYLDNQRDMAQELFEGNVASEMTLGDAIVQGILTAPEYVLSLYGYQEQIEHYQQKIRRIRNEVRRNEAEKTLQAMRRALDKAEGLDETFRKYMKNPCGKYLVFCSGVEHMNQMRSYVPQWFGRIDPAPHVYCAHTGNPESSAQFQAFKADGDPSHLKLLFCIDMLNEGIHLDDIDGVILLRPTVSPIIYKQQIGRCFLAGSHKGSVIFDVAMNIENLYSISAVEEEIREAVTFETGSGEASSAYMERFKVSEELRDAQRLFGQLNDYLSASWEEMYRYAERYYQEHGDLEVPRRYRTPEGFGLGDWVLTQRKIRAGERYGTLDERRIALLDAIGMVWDNVREASWKKNYAKAEEWYREKGNLNIPASYVTEDGVRLGRWIFQLRESRRTGRRRQTLSADHIKALDAIGMVWDVKEDKWERSYAAAQNYYREHGNLKVPARYVSEDGTPLGSWLSYLKQLYLEGTLSQTLTPEQIGALEELGMQWCSAYERKWRDGVSHASSYLRQYGNLNVPMSYVAEDGMRLGRWIGTQRAKQEKLTPAQRGELNALGMIWNINKKRKVS